MSICKQVKEVTHNTGFPRFDTLPPKQCGGQDATRTHSGNVTGLVGTQSF